MATSKTEQCYEILKSKIIDGTYGPGFRLVIDQLGREHGISSAPWREALRRLEAEDWVEIVPNAGAQVKTFDTGAWLRTIRLLARLEGLATALSAERLTAEDIAEARALNRAMEECVSRFDTNGFSRLNRRFHELLCSRCDDARLNSLLAEEWTRMGIIRRSNDWHAPGRALASVAEHDGILDLIEGGAGPEMIETAARRHEVKMLEAVQANDTARLADQNAAGVAPTLR